MTTPTQATSDSSHRPENAMRICWFVVIALLVVATLPMLTRSHLEGFTYMTETMSLALQNLALTDPLWSNNVSYFYLSRPGTVWMMAPLSALAPGAGYQILVWLATPFFLTGLVVVTKLWSQASWLACVAILLFIPVALDVNFYLNDNIVAAAFTLTGIALLLWSQRALALFAAGALLSVALLCRLDQILFIPLFMVFAVLGSPSIKTALFRLVALIAGFMVIHAGMWWLDPNAANLLLRVQVVSASDALWARGNSPLLALFARDLSAMTVAFTAATPAIIAGIYVMQQRAGEVWSNGGGLFDRQFVCLVLLILYPIAIYVVTFGKYYDPRGFLSVIPFIAPLAAMGVERYIVTPLRDGTLTFRKVTSQATLIAALLIAPVIVPGLPLIQSVMPVPHENENAPPSLTGRLWYFNTWSRWQDWFEDSEDTAARILAIARDGTSPTAIGSTDWNRDRLLQNSLAVAGFTPADSQIPACAALSEIWAHSDGTTVYHLRTHVPVLPDVPLNSAASYALHTDACLRSVQPAQRLSIAPFGVAVSWPPPNVAHEQIAEGVFQMSDADLDALLAVANATLTDAGQADGTAPMDVARDVLASITEILN